MKRILNGLISITLLGAAALQLAAASPTIMGVNCFGTIPDQIISPTTVTSEISFVVNDPDPGQTLRISGTSSDQTLVPDSNIIFGNPVATSGSPAVRSVRVLAGLGIGTTTITLNVADDENPPKTNHISFTLNIQFDADWFPTNPQEIIIRDRNAAVEYPSVISIRDYTGTIEKVTVNIIGFSHPFPDDVDMLLVSPHGESLLLMSDAGGAAVANNVRLTFDDDASMAIPDESSGALVSGTYKPSNYEGTGDPFPAPAPAGPYPATALSVFNGQSPNGDWKLYVMDDTFPDAGVIEGRWDLSFTTRPVITNLPASVTILENTTANVSFAIANDSILPPDLRFTFASSNAAVVGTNGVSFENTDFRYHALVTPQTNAIGTSVITIVATRAACQVASGTFTLIVQPFNTAPSFNVGVVQTVYEDAGPQTFEGWATHISSGLADESGQTVTFHVTGNSNPGLFSAGPAVSSSGTLTFTPAANANGSATISLVAQDDGGTLNGGVDTSAVQTFTITVKTLEDAPVVTTPKNLVRTEMNGPITIAFEIGDVDSTLRMSNLVVTSSNDAVVPNRPANLAISGSDVLAGTTGTVNVTVTPAANVMGDTVITFTATDGNSSVSTNVTLIVGPRNTPPTIAGANCFGTIPAQAAPAGATTANIPFLVNDPDPSQTLGIFGTSSDQTLVKNSSIFFDNAIAVSGGPSVRNVRITAEPGGQGLTTITLSVADDGNPPKTNSISFALNVGPLDPRFFSNHHPLTIRDNDMAVDYPSVISASGYRGVLSKVEVHINGFAHRFPDDVDMLLVSPHGEKLLLMSDAGGGSPVTNLNLKFDDSASAAVPDTSLAFGTFKPGNYDGNTDPFPAPAPEGPYTNTALSAFNGQSPNGDWKLYIVDDTAQDGGVITGGWSISFATRPVISDLPDRVTVSENTQASVSFILAEESFTQTDFVFTFASANTEVVGTNGVSFARTDTGYSATITPRPNITGSSVITIFATNPDCEVTSANITVNVIPGELRLGYEPFSTNGIPGLRIFSPSGTPYQLESSTEMLNWLPVFTNQNGAVEGGFIEAPLTNRLQRFFRAKQL